MLASINARRPANVGLKPTFAAMVQIEVLGRDEEDHLIAEKYPADWLKKVPAVVFGSLTKGEIRILLQPGSGLAAGGAPRDVPAVEFPAGLHMPNTLLWVELDETMSVTRV
ncbi:UNVERIFIED_ORG: hypothetical protein ABIC43_000577 [Variovorax guangxiensis]